MRRVARALFSCRRSIAKSLVWRAIGITLLGGITWAMTGNIAESIGITLVFNGIRVVLYVFHEEVWERWGPLAAYGRAKPSASRPERRNEPPSPMVD